MTTAADTSDKAANAKPAAVASAAMRQAAATLSGAKARTILPDAGAAGGPLVAVIAVMCFLATLALTGALAVSGAVDRWTSDLSGAVTVQIKGERPEEIAAQTQAALRVLRAARGVNAARAISRDAAEKMLEPWLGKDNLPASLPIPGLIEVDLNPRDPPDLDVLASRITAAAPLASLDDHRAWNERLLEFGGALHLAAFAALATILGATAAIVVFAAKAGLAANAEIVEVLHLIGAEDRFIASRVQRHFLALGLKGALAGLAVAVMLMALLALGAGGSAGSGGGYFLPQVGLRAGTLLWLVIVPIGACGLTALVARYTVLRELAQRV
ncbi:MAG: hypothetical protein AAF869_03525 [Pseudomonadota bacterium]